MDIDIDFPTDFDPLTIFDAVRASMVKEGKLVKHPVGIYFQNMPRDSVTGLAAIPYDRAQEVGYYKIDFLHLGVLDHFDDKEQIRKLIKVPPDWSLLQDEAIVAKLFQVGRQYQLLSRIKPQSIQELADVIALIRPGKRHLVAAYVKDKEAVRPELYTKPDNGKQYYKKSHAVAYALTIVLQLHLAKGGLL
jgi:DNA polymerase III alpha subunit